MAVDLQGFGQVRPAEFDYGSVFDRVRNAYKAGLLSRAEVEGAIRVIPAEQKARVAEAGLRTATAGEAMKVLPLKSELEQINLDWLKREGAGLQQKKARLDVQKQEQDLADPLGLKRSLAQDLLKYGITPTGDFAVDSKTLIKATEQELENIRTKERLEKAREKAANLQVEFSLNPDAELDVQYKALTEAIYNKEQEIELAKAEAKERDDLKKELVSGSGLKIEGDPDLLPVPVLRQRVIEAKQAAAATKAAEPKALTADQRMASMYLAEIQNTRKTLDALEKGGLDPSKEIAQTALDKFTPEMLRGVVLKPEFKQYRDAQDKWIEAVLRDRSGAAIAQSEYGNARVQYFPVLGDNEQAKAYKRGLRDAAEKTMADRIAGPTGMPGVASPVTPVTPVETPGAPASPQTTPPKVTNFEAGKVYTLTPKGGVPGQYLYLGNGKFRPAQ